MLGMKSSGSFGLAFACPSRIIDASPRFKRAGVTKFPFPMRGRSSLSRPVAEAPRAVRMSRMKRKIVGYHLDAESQWVAELECGHDQHVRHAPPIAERPWVTTEEGRASRLGQQLNCAQCDDETPPT
jgi:hypothetical protein